MDSSSERKLCHAILDLAAVDCDSLYQVCYDVCDHVWVWPLLLLCRHRSPGPYHYSALVAVTLAFLLPWQFSQFVLVTQVFSLLMLHSLRLLPSHQLSCIYISLAASFLANLVLQYFNRLLLTSVLPASIFSCLVRQFQFTTIVSLLFWCR